MLPASQATCSPRSKVDMRRSQGGFRGIGVTSKVCRSRSSYDSFLRDPRVDLDASPRTLSGSGAAATASENDVVYLACAALDEQLATGGDRGEVGCRSP